MTPPAVEQVRVVLADDHDLVRSGICALLSALQGVSVVAEARNGEELLHLLRSVETDIVITDIGMPKLDGIAATRVISEEHPHVRVIVLSMDTSAAAVRNAVASGACGFLRKDAARQELELAVMNVQKSGSYFGNGVAQLLLQPAEAAATDLLTARQVQILSMLAEGKRSKQIGFDLGISPKTIDVHRANIMLRLGLTDMASLTRFAVKNGLIRL